MDIERIEKGLLNNTYWNQIICIMDRIDTRDVELAFDELMKELKKLKDLNSLVDAYKDTVDSLSLKVEALTEQMEVFYQSAREHDNQVNNLYQGYVDKAEEIAKAIDQGKEELKRRRRSSMHLTIVILLLSVVACLGIAHLIFIV